MTQGVFNLIVGVYTIVTTMAISNLYKQFNLLNTIYKQQVEFNQEVINGFSITRKVLNNK